MNHIPAVRQHVQVNVFELSRPTFCRSPLHVSVPFPDDKAHRNGAIAHQGPPVFAKTQITEIADIALVAVYPAAMYHHRQDVRAHDPFHISGRGAHYGLPKGCRSRPHNKGKAGLAQKRQ